MSDVSEVILEVIIRIVMICVIYLGIPLVFLWVAVNWIALPALSYIATLFGV